MYPEALPGAQKWWGGAVDSQGRSWDIPPRLFITLAWAITLTLTLTLILTLILTLT